MSYPKTVLKKAMATLMETREENKRKTELNKIKIYEKIPELYDVNKMIHDAMMKIFDDSSINEVRTELLLLEQKKKELLLKNGYAENAMSDVFCCPICKDEGFFNGEPCECYLSLIKKEAYSLSNIGSRIETENFDTYDINLFSDKELALSFKRCAERFCNSDKEITNLIFSGPTGVGKTFLASCIAKSFLDNKKSVLYLTATSLSDIIDKAKFQRSDDDFYEEYLDFVETCDLLIIDDLGTEYAFPYPQSKMFDIIEKRIVDKRRTVISTNLSLNDISVKYSLRLYSRLLKDYTSLLFSGVDLRAGVIKK